MKSMEVSGNAMAQKVGFVSGKLVSQFASGFLHFLQFATLPGRQNMNFLAVIFLLALSTISARATTWYVDSSVSSSGNGQSWATAWKNISNISGVSAGDTVYISGGTSGSSRTYTMSGSWSPASGTSGNPITYQIGQDSSHDGTAIFSGNGVFYSGTAQNNTIFSGDAGDGALHFQLTGYSQIVEMNNSGNLSNWRFSYVSIPALNVPSNGRGLNLGTVTSMEFDHTDIRVTGTGADKFMNINSAQGSGFDAIKLHDNVLYIPYTGSAGVGCDGYDWGGNGVSIYNSSIYGFNGGGVNHQDGVQFAGGQNTRIYNNFFYLMQNSGVYLDGFGGNFTDCYVYNNIIQDTRASANGSIVAGNDTGGFTWTRVIMANNICQGGGYAVSLTLNGKGGSENQCIIANNCSISGSFASVDGAVSVNNNLGPGSSFTSGFVSWTDNSTNNDYHLKSTATSFIGQGANLSAYFTTDRAGNTRPATGAWDIGPYQYGSGAASTNPAVTALPTSLDFGTVLVNTSTNLTLSVRNSGGGTLTGSASVSSPFSIVSGGTYSLGSNQSQTVTVRFNPTSVGAASGSISFSGGNGGSAGVTGTGYSVQASLSSSSISATFNSTAGAVAAPFTANGTYISQATTTGLPGSGEAIYGFTLAAAGSYVVAAQVNAPDTSANSFYVNIDAEPTDPTMVWDVPPASGFALQTVSWRGSGTATNDQFVPQIFNLSAGSHRLIVRGKEAGAQLGAITISIPPPTPRIVSGP